MKSLREWASELKVEPSTLSRWIKGQRKVPEQYKAVLSLIIADLKPHKSSKFGNKILATNESLVELASNFSASKPVVEGSNPSRRTIPGHHKVRGQLFSTICH
jgi:hypothetical protein